MSWIGYMFWGIIIGSVVIGFYMEKKHGTGSIEKSNEQALHEEITRVTHNNDRPRL